MVDIRPFRAFHYDFEGLGKPPEALLAPPYDVISDEMKASLSSEPLNISNVMLGNRGDSYRAAKGILDGWISSRKVVQDEAPAYYVYEQTFKIEGRLHQRNGVIALLRLEPLGRNILPHERTHPKAKQDRRELLASVQANLEQIFMIYDDEKSSIQEILDRVKQPGNELLDFNDFDDVRHRVFRITREGDIERITSSLADKKALIADGHHRYEVAQSYSQEMDQKSGTGPHDFAVVTLVNARDPGLVMLPTHRLIRSLPPQRMDSLESKLSSKFDLEPVGDKASLLGKLEGSEGCGVIGVWRIKERKGFIANLKPEFCSKDPVERLDVSILHRYIIEEALGITPEMQERKEGMEFAKGTEESFKLAEEGDFQLLLLLTPASIPEIIEAAETGKLLPHKSTYFFPKLWSGLVMYIFKD